MINRPYHSPSGWNAADERAYTGWSDYLGGPDSAQYSALKQISQSNVSQLQVAWSYAVGNGIAGGPATQKAGAYVAYALPSR
jgi:glucose dehydrogenase